MEDRSERIDYPFFPSHPFTSFLLLQLYLLLCLSLSHTDHTMLLKRGYEGWVAYEYYPSMAAAVIFVVLFGTVTLLHSFHLFRTRTWFFIPLVIGGYCESDLLQKALDRMSDFLSRIDRIYWTLHVSIPITKLDSWSVHHAEHIVAGSACAVCCQYIHGTRSNYPSRQRGEVCNHSGNLDDQDICCGRRSQLLDASVR